MTDEQKKAIEYLENYKYDNEVREAIDVVLNLIQTQQEELEEYEILLDTFGERKYRKRYLEEERAKRPNLLYPDADEVYKRYYEQKEEIEKKDRQLEIKNRYLELIYGLGFDYDGWNEVKPLKALIDELVSYAKRAFNNDDKFVAYETFEEENYNHIPRID